MAITEILWKGENTWFLGRNGTFKCSGISVLPVLSMIRSHGDNGGIVLLEPITGKGVIGRATIAVEAESLPMLIQTLQEILDEHTTVLQHQTGE